MKKEKTKIEAAKRRNIELFFNNVLTNDSCAICGRRTDPGGIDYGIGKRLVCIPCAERYAPKMVKLKKEIDAYVMEMILWAKSDLARQIKQELSESPEERIKRIVNDFDLAF